MTTYHLGLDSPSFTNQKTADVPEPLTETQSDNFFHIESRFDSGIGWSEYTALFKTNKLRCFAPLIFAKRQRAFGLLEQNWPQTSLSTSPGFDYFPTTLTTGIGLEFPLGRYLALDIVGGYQFPPTYLPDSSSRSGQGPMIGIRIFGRRKSDQNN
ncbi:MAG: hypothetical protein ACD_62C00385G0007 [uncultured bacterium]|nr:MAG: hypothetical protein ACD_62C00385G0007 [uncultured bacterium]HLD45936.1 hypothetical protein [bacterium]